MTGPVGGGTKVSVALCTYEGARFLPAQLQSIIEQSRPVDEVIVFDDGSTDGTVDILRAFAAHAPFDVHVTMNEHRLRVTANYERALRACSGDIIVFCDQDDVWSPRRIERLVEAFDANPEAALAFSDAWLVDADDRRLPLRLWDAIDLGPRQRNQLRRDPFGFVLGRPAVTGCTLAIRASTVPLLLPFPSEDTTSDVPVLHDWWISVMLAAACGADRLLMLDEPLVSYRIHPAQRIGIPGIRARRWLPAWSLRLRNAAVPQRHLRARLLALSTVVEDVHSRLRLLDERPEAHLDLAAAHLRTRAGLHDRRVGRVGAVTRELWTGRYHGYSRGFVSAVSDLVRPRG